MLLGISQPVNLGFIGVPARVSVSLLAWARSHYGHCRLKKMSWRQHFRLSTHRSSPALRKAVGTPRNGSDASVPTPNCRVWWKQHETAMKLIAQADSLVLTMYSGEDDLHVTY